MASQRGVVPRRIRRPPLGARGDEPGYGPRGRAFRHRELEELARPRGGDDIPPGAQPGPELQRHREPPGVGLRQHRLCRGRERSAAGEPDPLPALLSRAAGLLPRGLGRLRLRPAERPPALLLAPHRARAGRADPDRPRCTDDGPGGPLRSRLLPDPNRIDADRGRTRPGDGPGRSEGGLHGRARSPPDPRAVPRGRHLHPPCDGCRSGGRPARGPAHGWSGSPALDAELPRGEQRRAQRIRGLELGSRPGAQPLPLGPLGSRVSAQLSERHLVRARLVSGVR